MKLFLNFLFIFTISFTAISCGGGSYNSDEDKAEINIQVSADLSPQNIQADTKKIIEEIPQFDNAKFDEAIFN